MRVLVCGGRDYSDRAYVFDVLDELHRHVPVTEVIEGGARGADSLAKEWARARHVEVVEVPADWSTHGRAAGPIRNQKMLDDRKPEMVIAFPGGSGTADMIRRARAAGVVVFSEV